MASPPRGSTLSIFQMDDYRRFPTLLMEMVDLWQMLPTLGLPNIHQNQQVDMAENSGPVDKTGMIRKMQAFFLFIQSWSCVFLIKLVLLFNLNKFMDKKK